ncbi:hypothetical protein BDQ12DRAFT_663651 [Crucibulum laeve]|uniref:F-box domain-containing protein n=1 Tax=Crucibulum laeve TaxID=68775 RepID=A0A5C3MAE8_9AGAR|nr:hypothetical protein BDQ12DRAFT_663651 [Crucibulum laeve]
MAPPALPYDIWLSIALFLSRTQLLNLYSLNSAFLHASISARYRSVSISTHGSKRLLRKLTRLRDPFISSRVRCVRINVQFGDSRRKPRDFDKGRKRVDGWEVHILRPRYSGSSPEPEVVLDIVDTLRIILPFVKEYIIDANAFNLYSPKLPYFLRFIFSEAWSTLAQSANLRSLSLTSTALLLSQLVANSTLPRLRSLFLKTTTTSTITRLWETQPLYDFLLSFPSLQCISISHEKAFPYMTFPSFLFNSFSNVLGTLPCLESIHLSKTLVFPFPFQLSYLQRILTDPPKKITHLSLCSSLAGGLASPNIFSTFLLPSLLPHLEALILEVDLLPSTYISALACLRPLLSQISVLGFVYPTTLIRTKTESYHALLENMQLGANVKCLKLQFPGTVNAQVLRILVKAFERLECLYLDFLEIAGYTRRVNIDHLRAKKAKNALGRWKVKHLRLAMRSSERAIVKEYADLFRESIPSLESCRMF